VRRSIRFSTEILYENRISFTDGDVLVSGSGTVEYTNYDLIDCFEPKAKFLGLDALHIGLDAVEEDEPYITKIGHRPTGDIDGGSVSIGGGGTGLADYLSYDRPFGGWVPIHGHIPSGIHEFRVVFRKASTPRPSPAAAPGIAVAASIGWTMDEWDGFACQALTSTHSSDGNGWFDAAEYLNLTSDPCNANMALTVWDTDDLGADKDEHFVIWMQWRTLADPLTIVEEDFDHHIQLDNTDPEILALGIPGGACTGYGPATMPITPTANVYDAHFWRYQVRLFGGDPPDHEDYPNSYYNLDPNFGPTGSGGGDADLYPVDVADLDPLSIVDCCYGLRLRVRDRTIICSFTPGENAMPWHPWGHWVDEEITFQYSP
jgi:hypothetical protein